jgi:hypothetical protein
MKRQSPLAFIIVCLLLVLAIAGFVGLRKRISKGPEPSIHVAKSLDTHPQQSDQAEKQQEIGQALIPTSILTKPTARLQEVASSLSSCTATRKPKAQVSTAADIQSEFDRCASTLTEFMQKHPQLTPLELVEGYSLVAQCQERLGQLNEAMFSYAKAVVIGGELADPDAANNAKERLERLYRSLHNNNTYGIEKIYTKARQSIAEQLK